MVNTERGSAWSRLEYVSYRVSNLAWVAAVAIVIGAVRSDPGTLRLGIWSWALLQPPLAIWDYWNAEASRPDGDRRRTVAIWAATPASWAAFAVGHALDAPPGLQVGLAILAPAWGLLGRVIIHFLRRDRLRPIVQTYTALAAVMAAAALMLAVDARETLIGYALAVAFAVPAAVVAWRREPAPASRA